eukprot:SM000161S02438  [mRNA]  locus=s161:201625:206924:+ [translate_table: standard]
MASTHARRLLLLQAELDRAGVRLALIGPGNAEQAQGFRDSVNFPGDVFADPERATFRALDFESGVGSVFSPKAAVNLVSATLEGFSQDWGLSLQPDTIMRGAWQQGGLIVAGPGTDKLIFLHKGRGRHPPPPSRRMAFCWQQLLHMNESDGSTDALGPDKFQQEQVRVPEDRLSCSGCLD